MLKRWLSELDAAQFTEKDWRKCGEDNWKLYDSEKGEGNVFNILWSNTETLRPALYNSLPAPDVRRRFRDRDPVARVASEVLERSLKYQIDSYDFDYEIQLTVLDTLIPGRGVARIKYEPKFRPQAGYEPDPLTDEEPPEEIDSEYALCEHVQWDDFRRGPGKTWNQVPWVAFGHRMPFDQLVEMFGEETAKKVKLIDSEKTDKVYDKEVRSLLKTAYVWEIWDKAKRRVLFISESYSEGPLLEKSDPLHLQGFLPMPRPLYAIEDAKSLIPRPLYQKYEVQARELNKISVRIDKIVAALKVRGGYAANLQEVAGVIEATDNQMIPIVNASEVAAMGGLDKAIWIMPIDKLAGVLEDLYVAREKTLQTIYEITGLGDVMRGVSNPHETLGAQQLKSQWGTLRLQRMQREVQRFIRDLMRLKAEVISEHFQPETLQAMTGIQLPTEEDKQKLQQQAAMAAQQGQQIPPEVQEQGEKILSTPTWNDVIGLLRSDEMRRFHIGIETDSTIAETLTRDAQGMQEAITAVVNLFTGLAPAVESQALSIEVVKEIGLAMARQARMGDAVEAAIEQMKQPPPPQPEPMPPDHSIEVAQIKAQSDQQIAQVTEAAKTQLAQVEAQHAQQLEQMKLQTEASKLSMDAQIKQVEAAANARVTEIQEAAKAEIAHLAAASKERIAAADREAELVKAAGVEQLRAESKRESDQLKAAVQIITAQMSAMTAEKAADAKAEGEAKKAEAKQADESKTMAALQQVLDFLQKNSGPKKFEFESDEEGNVIGAIARPHIEE